MTKTDKIFLSIMLISVIILCTYFLLNSINSENIISIILAIIGPLGIVVGVIITSYVGNINAKRDRINSIALASLNRRLDAHQEAYALWREIIDNLPNEDKLIEIIRKCNDWWRCNCLYLEKDSRQAFRKAYDSAGTLIILRRTGNHSDLTQGELTTIYSAGGIIAEGVELPSLNELEYK